MLVVLFTWYQTGEAINQAEVFHNPHCILYVNPGPGQIEVRAKRDCVKDVYVVIKTECLLMTVEYGNENFDTVSLQKLRFSIDPQSYRILRSEI